MYTSFVVGVSMTFVLYAKHSVALLTKFTPYPIL